jgi:hypothetical protein
MLLGIRFKARNCISESCPKEPYRDILFETPCRVLCCDDIFLILKKTNDMLTESLDRTTKNADSLMNLAEQEKEENKKQKVA